MSAPLRFLGLAIIGYVGLRTAASAFALTPLEEVPLPPPATPLLDVLGSPDAGGEPMAAAAGQAPPGITSQPTMPQPQVVPVYLPYPAAGAYLPPPRMSRPVVYAMATPEPMAASALSTMPPVAPLHEGPAIPQAGAAAPRQAQATPSWTGRRLNPARENRWQLTSWAMLRQPDPNLDRAPDPSLAPNGLLGGSQVGARLTYRATNRLSVAVRVSSPLDQQMQQQQSVSGEGALGVSWRPWRNAPVRLLAERRQRFGPAEGGRNAFAVLAEGGIYGQPLGWGMLLDGYGQAGMVGLKNRDLFVEGGATVTRPLLNRFALGGGVWGGLQPGISRLDAGPRLSYRWTPRVRVHLDYRWKLIGNASPPSGPAVTVAGDF